MNNCRSITACLLCMMMVSCNTSRSFDPSKAQFVKQLDEMYNKDIIDFFPSESNLIHRCGSYFSSSWDDSSESQFSCCAYFSATVTSYTLDSLEMGAYIKKIIYNDSLFLINVPYIKHEESYPNPMKDTFQIPIADMRYSFFTLGETSDTIIIDNRAFVVESEIIPGDLVVYVLEARKGNFWKNQSKAAQEVRPMLLEPWKHGYVKGLAISRALSRVCWWAMAW